MYLFSDSEMDMDPNYDPSDFLHMSQLGPRRVDPTPVSGPSQGPHEIGIHDDLAISDSDEETSLNTSDPKVETKEPENDDDGGGLWF